MKLRSWNESYSWTVELKLQIAIAEWSLKKFQDFNVAWMRDLATPSKLRTSFAEQLVGAPHRYRELTGFNPAKVPCFFQAL